MPMPHNSNNLTSNAAPNANILHVTKKNGEIKKTEYTCTGHEGGQAPSIVCRHRDIAAVRAITRQWGETPVTAGSWCQAFSCKALNLVLRTTFWKENSKRGMNAEKIRSPNVLHLLVNGVFEARDEVGQDARTAPCGHPGGMGFKNSRIFKFRISNIRTRLVMWKCLVL